MCDQSRSLDWIRFFLLQAVAMHGPRLGQDGAAFVFLTGALVLALVTLMPFVAALEIHHALAAADHDGHQHSETDLCQWVQQHTGHSLFCFFPLEPLRLLIATSQPSADAIVLSARLVAATSPRGPPVS